MAARKLKNVKSELSLHDAFSTLVYTLQQNAAYEIGALSNERCEVVASKAKSAFSWGHLVAGVVVEENNSVELRLVAENLPNAPWSLMDGRKNQKVLDDLAAEVEANMALNPLPVPEPVQSFQHLNDGTIVPWTDNEYSNE